MYKALLFNILVIFFCACQNKTAEKIIPITERNDKLVYITVINSVEDTLFGIENATKGILQIYYKGDSIILLQDSVSKQFKNKSYTLIKQNDTTTLYKKRKIIFQNPFNHIDKNR